MSVSISISIRNWDKFNPRKDLKSMPWIRLQGDIGFSESLFGLNAEAKWLWIFVLSYSSKKMVGTFSIDRRYLSYHSGVDESKIEKYLNQFIEKGLLSMITESSRITNESDRITNESVPNERTNERTNERAPAVIDVTVDECVPYFDSSIREHPLEISCYAQKERLNFERLYDAYPKKEGKKKGIEKLSRTIKTREKYAQVMLAIKNYSVLCEGTEKKYIKQFSSFVSVWEDYLEMDFSEEGIPDEVDWDSVEVDPYLDDILKKDMETT